MFIRLENRKIRKIQENNLKMISKIGSYSWTRKELSSRSIFPHPMNFYDWWIQLFKKSRRRDEFLILFLNISIIVNIAPFYFKSSIGSLIDKKAQNFGCSDQRKPGKVRKLFSPEHAEIDTLVTFSSRAQRPNAQPRKVWMAGAKGIFHVVRRY